MADKKIMNGNVTSIKLTPKQAQENSVSGFTFGLFIFFNIDFFLHLSARIPGYGVIRPSLLLVLILSFLLFSQRHKFHSIYQAEPFKRIKWLVLYLVASFLLVRWPGSVLSNLPDFVKAVCFFFFIAMIVDTEKRLKVFLFVFIGCQLIRVYEPLYLNLTQGYWGGRTYLGYGEFAQRLSGAPSDVINQNELGFVIATVVPFIYYLLWGGRLKAKLLFVVLVAPLLYALILTMSRGALIALLVVGWMIFKSSKYKILLLVVAIGVAISGWAVMTDIQKERYISLFESSDSAASATADGRLDGMFNELVFGLTSRPVFGNGLGTTEEAKFNEWGKSMASHNLYAELLIEIGIIGAVFFLLFLRALLRELKKMRDAVRVLFAGDEGRFWSSLSLAMFAIFWMYVVYSVNYYGLSQYYWYMFGGLVISIGRISGREVEKYG